MTKSALTAVVIFLVISIAGTAIHYTAAQTRTRRTTSIAQRITVIDKQLKKLNKRLRLLDKKIRQIRLKALQNGRKIDLLLKLLESRRKPSTRPAS
ncbi:MAG: hypothetical protein KDB07_03210 [Planctomycetes bacterium]|nr:hypothetical protein [Planctomycetota bacterium]